MARRRRSGSKSRTGCATWTRHIKCDETRPHCKRCTTSGWKCPGYPVPQNPRHYVSSKDTVRQNGSGNHEPITSKLLNPKGKVSAAYLVGRVGKSLLEVPGTPDEQRAFDFFFARTTPDLKAFSDSPFWNHLVLQVAYSEISVRHAVTAVAALHEDRLREIDARNPANEAFSLSQYNKAIRALNSRLSSDKRSYQVTLVTCVIFVYLEFLRGSPETALLHLDNGLKLLPSYNKHCTKVEMDTPSSLDPEEKAVDRELMRTFSSFRTSALAVTSVRHHEVDVDNEKPTESMEVAQRRLASLLFDVQIDPVSPFPKLEDGDDTKSKPKEVNALYNDWSIWLENYSRNRGSVPTLQELRAIRIIRVHDLLKTIWNSIPVSGQTVNYEKHLPLFRAIISLVEQVTADTEESQNTVLTPRDVNIGTSELKSKPITDSFRKIKPAGPLAEQDRLEISIAFILFFTVIKCRCPSVRRHALSLFPTHKPSTTTTSDTWHPNIFKAVSQYLIDFEESQCAYPVTDDVSTWPKEEQQIQRIYFLPIYDNEKRTQTVMFVWQPDGPGTDMKNWMIRFDR